MFLEKELSITGPMDLTFRLISQDSKITRKSIEPIVLSIIQNHTDYGLI